MSKTSRFRGPIDKQHKKMAQTLFKSEQQRLYHIYWSVWRVLSWKKSPLVMWKILGLFVKTLTADNKCSLPNRENSTLTIHMQLSQKQKTFCQYFSTFLKSRLNFEHSRKKDDPHIWCIPKLQASKNVAR